MGKDSKPHIGIFGRRNNGKSSLINFLAQQDLAIVSEVAGTTTDPVKKSMEIPGIGPVIIIDTAGIDDEGELGGKRIQKSMAAIKTIDFALLVITANEFAEPEKKIITELQKFDVPFLTIQNKADVSELNYDLIEELKLEFNVEPINFSTFEGYSRDELVKQIRKGIPETAYLSKSLVGDIIKEGDLVLLITPIDAEAPEGRLILPQVQAIRDILDNNAIAVVCKEREVDTLLKKLSPEPALAICDSQVFLKAGASVPNHIPLTSFSTVLARYKGDFQNYIKGTPHLSKLNDGDKVLILESCTHQTSCDDIGRVKVPRWLSNFTGKNLSYEVVAGLNDIPGEMTDYAMVIQCGGCMITRKQMISRLKPAIDLGIPVTNYGMGIAYMHGIYERAVAPFVKIDRDSLDYL
ncbi:MAG: [FeFe] hydrogenase H-cluster maturation GTPase HydF [Salinivirgaceae bacterium]|jgi:[FeFe] hydrogenase H-cluster maturation GTPase HydF|nr:[FeFe] hydrogenase H-cluster maturation GTPase HydF [Salinivirgaceae bacterium]